MKIIKDDNGKVALFDGDTRISEWYDDIRVIPNGKYVVLDHARGEAIFCPWRKSIITGWFDYICAVPGVSRYVVAGKFAREAILDAGTGERVSSWFLDVCQLDSEYYVAINQHGTVSLCDLNSGKVYTVSWEGGDNLK